MQPLRFLPYGNVMEMLVTEEVERQLQHLPPKLAKDINPAQVSAYALNRLLPLYATSQEGWNRQEQRAKQQFENQIFLAVRCGLVVVERELINTSISRLELPDAKHREWIDSYEYYFRENYNPKIN